MKIKKPLIYIMSPYTKGDTAINVGYSMRAWHEMLDSGLVVPVAPLLTHFMHILKPRKYEDWMEVDEVLMLRCDAAIRISVDMWIDEETHYVQSDSSGADREEVVCKDAKIPVFYSLEEMYSWAKQWIKENNNGLPDVIQILHGCPATLGI